MTDDHDMDHDLPSQPNLNFGVAVMTILVVGFIGIIVGAMIAHGEGAEVLGIVPILIGCAVVAFLGVVLFAIGVAIRYAVGDRRRHSAD